MLGTNGNGKSTLMKCIMGMVRPSAGTIVAEIDGRTRSRRRSTEEIGDVGIALVPKGGGCFPQLPVEENLLLGAFRATRAQGHQAQFDSATGCSTA